MHVSRGNFSDEKVFGRPRTGPAFEQRGDKRKLILSDFTRIISRRLRITKKLIAMNELSINEIQRQISSIIEFMN